MDFATKINALGERIAAALWEVNADLGKLPEIAERELADFEDVDGVALETLIDFLQWTTLRQQTKNPFSDLPLTIFRSRDFYIELLVWSNATTVIHQHGFGGAFRVVRGSSIHTRYAFEPRHRVSLDCMFGEIEPLGSEHLEVGAVRRIDPGMGGLIHSLYHLDDPSISLIVRDRGHSAFGPQFSYYPPSLALHRTQLEPDEQVSMFSRVIDLLSHLDRPVFREFWCGHVARLEFPRMAILFRRYHGQLDQQETAAFRRSAENVHGDLIPALFDSMERFANQQLLARMRERVQDPELRFFLALLMNVPARSDLLRMVTERFPERDPVACCAQWLARLSVDEKSAEDRMKEVAAMIESSGMGAMQFSRQLRKALPGGTGYAEAIEHFKRFIDGENVVSVAPGPDAPAEPRDSSLAALNAIPQLSALRTKPRLA